MCIGAMPHARRNACAVRTTWKCRPRGRRGTMSLELVLNVAVFFLSAMAMYWLGQDAFSGLYEIAATIAGSPLY